MTAVVEEQPVKRRVRRKPPPRVLVLRCDKCAKRVARNAYLKVDRIAVATHKDGEELIYWRVLHADCDLNAKTTDYRLRAELFSTTGDLLEATAFLMRNEPWIIRTNWHGLIGRVLADTREYADALIDVKRQAWRERRREKDRERRERQNGVLEVFEENDYGDD